MTPIQIHTFGKRKHLRHNEYQTYCTEVQTAIEKINADVDGMSAATVQAFTQALEAYSEANVVVSKSALTQQLNEADRERDSVFMGLMEHIRSATRHYKTELRNAAAVLMPTLNTYAGTQNKSVADKTGYLNNFTADLQAEKFNSARATLGIDEWLTLLQTANERYITLSEQRATDRSTITPGAVKAARAALDEAYCDLVRMLNALCVVFGSAGYAETFAYINTRIKYYESLLAQRAGVAKAKRERPAEE